MRDTSWVRTSGVSDMTYAVHTATCCYLLDDEGICRWALGPGGPAPPPADRCVGAQFVACLDLQAEGGLVGELRLGAAALFVRREGGRFALLRTLPITHVELSPPAVEDPPTDPLPLPSFNPEETEILDLEELLSVSVTEFTFALPLYRLPQPAPPEIPPPQPPPAPRPPPHRPPRRR